MRPHGLLKEISEFCSRRNRKGKLSRVIAILPAESCHQTFKITVCWFSM